MNEVQFISHFEGLNLDQNITKYEKKIKNGMAELINMTNQIKIENFLSGDLSDPLIIDYIDVINSVKRIPTKIYNHFTGMNSGIILDWILIIMKNPEAFARIVAKYFRNDSKNLSYFSAITFPGLFHHFFTEDFQKLSYQFLMSMLESGDIGTFWYFCLSFIESSSNFSIVLWSNFLNFNENQNIFFSSSHFSQQNSQPKIQKSQVFFRFLKCLKIASSSLSIYQQQIIKKFFDANAATCSFFLCKYFIERSFFWFRGNEPDRENQVSEKRNPSASSSDRSGQNPFLSADSSSHQNSSDNTYNEAIYQNNIFNQKNANYVRSLNEEMIKILEYAALNPKSPQFTAIVNVLTSSGLSRFVPNLVSSHTYFILSQRDCYLIQEIIKKNAQDKKAEIKDQHENEFSNQNINSNDIKFVNVFPLTKDSFANFIPMSIEIPLANFIKLYNDKKGFNPNREDFSIFQIKNSKFEKLMDLIIFDHFIENEYSKRKHEQIRSHFCFASKLLQKKQFVKRKMIDFNGFYGYFQAHNYKIKRHTHSNQSVFNESKPKKGITSYNSYYSHKTENIFDLPKLSTLSPEPAAPKCPLSSIVKNDNDSTNSFEYSHEKKSVKRRVVFNQSSDDDDLNSFKIDQVPYKNEKNRRKSLNIRRSFSDLNPGQKRDFGYNNDEYVMKVETKQPRKKRPTFNLIESTYHSNQIGNETNSSTPSSRKNNSNENQNEKANKVKSDNADENDDDDDNNNDLEEVEKTSKKKDKKQEKKRKKKEKKEKKKNKKNKNKEEKKQNEKSKEDDKEVEKEEKILLKENEKKEKKEKKKLLKQKKEEEKRQKINKKKEKRREKMRKNIEKKIRKNSEIFLSGDLANDDDDDSDSNRSLNENKIQSDNNSSDLSDSLILDLNDQKSPRNDSSSESNNNNNDDEKDVKKDDDKKVESKAAKETNSKNFELRKFKSPKKKRKSNIHSKSDLYAYFSSSILLSSSPTKEIHPILHSLIPQIEDNESKLILYCIKLNDFEFNSKKVDQITSQYVMLFNSQRLRKIRKYLTIHSNWFRAAKFLASEIDFMSDFNIGTAIIIFCQICKFFSPLSSYTQDALNEISLSSYSNGSAENNMKAKSKNTIITNKELLQSSISIEEESENSSNDSTSVYKSTFNENDNSIVSDTETSLDIYSYKNDDDYDSESTNSIENTNSNSELNSNAFEQSSYLMKDSKGNQVSIFPPTLISKDIVKFLRFVLMLSHTDCFIRYFTWITRVLVVFPQIKIIICQIYGHDVSHLEIAFKTLLAKIDKPLLIEIGKEVFKKPEIDEN